MSQNFNTLFVLGGNDAEMELIKQLLNMAGIRWLQPNKAWGDHSYSPKDLGLTVVRVNRSMGSGASSVETLEADPTVVFVECKPVCWPEGALNMTVIDHHGQRSGEPASVSQVVKLLEMTMSEATRRWVELVAANDAGYIPAMEALGATQDEIARVRALDRKAQGVTQKQEIQAEIALEKPEVEGRLTTVRLSHSKTSTVCDRLYGRYDQLLVISEDGEVNFFGDGALCAALKEKFEGWSGGSGLGKAGQNAFWGGYAKEDVVALIREQLGL